MTNKALILLLSLTFSLHLNAQEEIEKTPITIDHEIGINATSLLKQLINLSDTTIATSPYLVTYKLMLNELIGLRAGLGGKYKRTEETEEGFEDSAINTVSAFDYRIGVEWQKRLSKRWKTSVGLDFIGSSSLDKTVIDTGFDVVTFEEKSSAYGGGPMLGVSFNINKNISLYTEGAAYFTVSNRSETQDFKNFPEFNEESNKVKEEVFNFQLPTTLYLVFTF